MSIKIGIGKVLLPQGSSAPSYSPEYQAVYDSWTNKPSAEVSDFYNTLILAWIASGAWAKRDIIHNWSTHTNDDGEALTNWKNPGTFDATLVGAPVFVPFEGFTSPGIGNYIRLHWLPGTDGVNYQTTNASFGAYIRALSTSSSNDMGGYDGSNINYLICDTGTRFVRCYINSTSFASIAATPAAGIKCHDKRDATTAAISINGVVTTGVKTTQGIPDVEQYALTANVNGVPGTPSNRQQAFCVYGGSMTDAEYLGEAQAMEAYMVANGKGL